MKREAFTATELLNILNEQMASQGVPRGAVHLGYPIAVPADDEEQISWTLTLSGMSGPAMDIASNVLAEAQSRWDLKA